MKKKIKQYDWKKYDYLLLVAVIVLCLISSFAVKLAGGDKGISYMRGQLTGMFLGIMIVAVLSLFDYHFLCRFAIIYYIFGILLTLATHSPIGTNNHTDAYRWVKIFGITFQPSELMKVIYIIALAVLLTKLKNYTDRVSTFFIAVAITIVPTLAIVRQPDLSSGLVVLFILLVVVVVGGVSYKILAPIFALSIPFTLVLFWYIQQPYNFLLKHDILKKYQYKRIMAWLHPDNDPGQLNMQQNKAIRAIASGGLMGKFIQDGGNSTTSRLYSNIPINESDFIWSVIGEEFGFLGCCLILLLFAFIIFKCLKVAKQAQDYLGRLIAVGVAAMFAFQIFANICVVTLIFPNTGLPLPFVSHGLSSMIASMMGIGLVMNICIQPAKSSKGGFSMRNSSNSGGLGTEIDFDLEL